MSKTVLQVKNYPTKKHDKLKKATIDAKCELVDIVVPAVDEYLSTRKHLKQNK